MIGVNLKSFICCNLLIVNHAKKDQLVALYSPFCFHLKIAPCSHLIFDNGRLCQFLGPTSWIILIVYHVRLFFIEMGLY